MVLNVLAGNQLLQVSSPSRLLHTQAVVWVAGMELLRLGGEE